LHNKYFKLFVLLSHPQTKTIMHKFQNIQSRNYSHLQVLFYYIFGYSLFIIYMKHDEQYLHIRLFDIWYQCSWVCGKSVI